MIHGWFGVIYFEYFGVTKGLLKSKGRLARPLTHNIKLNNAKPPVNDTSNEVYPPVPAKDVDLRVLPVDGVVVALHEKLCVDGAERR